MTTMTMSTTVERTRPIQTYGVSQWAPLLLAIALQTAVAVVSIMISGPMH